MSYLLTGILRLWLCAASLECTIVILETALWWLGPKALSPSLFFKTILTFWRIRRQVISGESCVDVGVVFIALLLMVLLVGGFSVSPRLLVPLAL